MMQQRLVFDNRRWRRGHILAMLSKLEQLTGSVRDLRTSVNPQSLGYDGQENWNRDRNHYHGSS